MIDATTLCRDMSWNQLELIRLGKAPKLTTITEIVPMFQHPPCEDCGKPVNTMDIMYACGGILHSDCNNIPMVCLVCGSPVIDITNGTPFLDLTPCLAEKEEED